MAGQTSIRVACAVVLTGWATAGCLDGHIQSQEPYREEGGMSVRVLRSSDLLDAPMSGKVVGSVRAGDTVTVLCFLRVGDKPVVQVTGVAKGFVTLNHAQATFDASVSEIRSVVAPCER